MTYIEASTRFWRTDNDRLGVTEAALYFALIDIANRGKWTPTFQVSNDLMCMKLKITEKTFRKARENLIAAGLISIERKGVAKTLTSYKLLAGNSPANIPANIPANSPANSPANIPANSPDSRGDNRGDKLPSNGDKTTDTSRQEDKESGQSPTPPPPPAVSEFDARFAKICETLLGFAGDMWREEVQMKHGVTDFKSALARFRSFVILNSLEDKIDSQGSFRRYFNWKAAEFLTAEEKRKPKPYFARIEKLSDTEWVVHQYGGIDPIPVGTPDPPGPDYAWTGIQWEHT